MGANAQTTVPTFTTGQVLTADQQNQSARTGVPVFATTITRDAGFGSTGEKTLAEGQLCYVESTGLQTYNGTSWVTWGTAPSTGAVVQVKQMQLATEFITTSTTFTDITNLNLAITPTSASNNVLIIWSTQGLTQGSYETCFQLVRGTTAIQQQLANDTDGDTYNVTTTYLDSPATTSSTTYKLQTRRSAATGGGVVVNWNSNQQGRSSIILMEVTP